MIDLCGVFGVKEGEEFKITNSDFKYVIRNNRLKRIFNNLDEVESNMGINDLSKAEVAKLPKKKAFTDDELAIIRSLPEDYEWIARDLDGTLFAFYIYKPKKENNCWDNNGRYRKLDLFTHLFQSITWGDEEPVYRYDYVKKQGDD